LIARLIAWAARYSWTTYQSVRVTVPEGNLRIPFGLGIGLDFSKAQESIDEVVGLLLRESPPGAFVDVGANIGRVMAGVIRADPARRYLGVEPLLPAAEFIWRLIRENDLGETCSVHAVALSDRPGLASLLLNSDADVMATMSDKLRPQDSYKHSAVVSMITGDELLADIPDVAIIKIDVEGAESRVLWGLRETITRCRPTLYVEVLSFRDVDQHGFGQGYLGEFGPEQARQLTERREAHAAEIEAFVEEFDYKLYQLRAGRLVPAGTDESRVDAEDFFVFPSERTPGSAAV
jgi:FkbM family methyltransferase